jgi:fatty-acyl-CoA synthase/long-chain acyl-CoA synthetase
MTDLLSMYAAQLDAKPAIIDDRPGQPVRSLSFKELDLEANRLGHVLVDLGVMPGDKVLWCGQNSLPLMVMMHAARRVGATAVPLNYRLTADEAAYVVDDSDASVVYVDAEFEGLFSSIRPQIPKVRQLLVFDGDGQLEQQMAAALPDGIDVPSAPGAQATMIYTSGTTGRPKGALRAGAGDPNQTAALVALIGYRQDDIYLTTGPLYHSGPGGFAYAAHLLGNTVVVQHHFDPVDWLRLVDAYKVSSTFSAPTPIRMVCTLPAELKNRYDRTSIRIMLANAAPWSMALKKLYLADFPPESLWEIYGSTELGVDTLLSPPDQLRKPGSCGLAAPGVEVKLLDETGREITESNVPGELYVRSASVFSTYYKADDKYEEERQGEFHTVGDIAYRDDEGYYYICDRKKDMVISGGMNIYPAEIEAALEQHPDIFDVAVFGVPSEEWGESVHAVVVTAPGRALADEEVIAFARQHLAAYKVPRSVTFMGELPRTGSGKILKRELRAPFWAGRESQVG